MGFVVAAIAALTATEVVVGLIAIVVLWEPVLKPALKAIAGLFGIKDHDVVKTNMASQRIISDATLNKFQSKRCKELTIRLKTTLQLGYQLLISVLGI